jgi:hypothetical protein
MHLRALTEKRMPHELCKKVPLLPPIVFFFDDVVCCIVVRVNVVDIATVVGYFVVSRPFLNLAHPRHLHSTHSERLEVSVDVSLLC